MGRGFESLRWLQFQLRVPRRRSEFGVLIPTGRVINGSGGVPEWSKGTDCKSVGEAIGGSNPPPTTIQNDELYVGDFGC